MPEKAWFGPKRSGLGFLPVTWQGWVILVLFVAVLTAVVVDGQRAGTPRIWMAGEIVVLAATFLAVAFWSGKGEGGFRKS
ncbi:MAG: hypothetical protein ACYDDF_05880 [Thermoplasmatota archaeon]